MSATISALTVGTSRPFTLRIAGSGNLIGKAALDSPFRITLASEEDPGRLVFTIEDEDASLTPNDGAEVLLSDNRAGSQRTLFAGHLLRRRLTQRGSGRGRYIECEALGMGAWLDWRLVVNWSSRSNVAGRVRQMTSDRHMVLNIINGHRAVGSPLTARHAEVDETNTNMDVVAVRGVMLREALEQVADVATVFNDSPTRHFYVDAESRVHYYRDREGLTAPYRIADGYLTRDVITTAGLVELWTMRESSGTTAYGAQSINATLTGGVTTGAVGGVVNEPQLTAFTFNGTTGYLTASGASLHPGNTFSLEVWFRRTTLAAAQAIFSGGTGDYLFGFDATDHIRAQLEGTGDHFVSTPTYTDTDWHHLVWTRSPGNSDFYVDGAAIAGSTTARTFAAAAGAVNIGRKLSTVDQFYGGRLQHAAIYSSKLTAATVLAHYNQGISLTPDDLTIEYDSFDGRERVYVAGANAAGSGHVTLADLGDYAQLVDFGSAGYRRDALIDRPDSHTIAKKKAYGRAWLRQNAAPYVSGSFTIVGYDGWLPGQTLAITSTALGLNALSVDIASVETDLLLGSGIMSHNVTFGRLPQTAMRKIGRRGRRDR